MNNYGDLTLIPVIYDPTFRKAQCPQSYIHKGIIRGLLLVPHVLISLRHPVNERD